MMVPVDAVDPYVPERGNRGYAVTGYDLVLDYTVGSNRLNGVATISGVALERLPRLTLDLIGLRVLRAAVDGSAARWRPRRGKVDVTPTRAIEAGAAFRVELRYAGNPKPTSSTWGHVGWEELTDGILVAAQPSGAATWFPCNDFARQKAPLRVTVTAASPYSVVANGRLVSGRVRGSKTTWVYEQAEPTSPYLATLHVGRYEEHDLADGPVPIRAVVPAGQRRAVEAAFGRQAEMMEVFVDRFGPYPFEAGYTVVVTADPLELPLEAQGQAIFGVNHLDGTHERLIAHELAHQWFGNSLTAASWRDVWLHEGFACYAEWLWSEASGGPSADHHARSHHERLAGLPQDLLLGDPGPADMFDDRVYKRGALTLHALRTTIGDGAFFDLLRRWAKTHQHGVVTTEEFEAMAEEFAARPLGTIFDPWLRRKPLPALDAPG
jgi:aminopeptidase N